MHGAQEITAISFLGGVHPLEDAHSPEDDWTGITSTAERKKRQNRLNQRAHRRRKQGQQNLRQSQSPDESRSATKLPTLATPPSTTDDAFVVLLRSFSWTPAGEGTDWTSSSSAQLAARLRAVIRRAYEEHSLASPRPGDLLAVIRINVMNAMVRNAEALGFPTQGLCADEYVSPFNHHGPHALKAAPLPLTSCPESLRPTDVQKRYAHHPWIDLFPFPRFRDNVLLAVEAGLLDEDELCLDVTETEAVRVEDEAKPALIVWGEAWDCSGWEANAAFVRRWGWLLRGCKEIVEATNYWRVRRGEKRIVFDPR